MSAAEEELYRSVRQRHQEWIVARESAQTIRRDRETVATPDREYQYRQAVQLEVRALRRYGEALQSYREALTGNLAGGL